MIAEPSERKSKLLDAISNSLTVLRGTGNVRYINPDNYEQLGRFHKQMIYNFGRMYNLVSKDAEVDYDEFVQVFEKLFEMRTDVEKQYIWGLFFPNTIKHATFLNPFPVPVFSYKQTFTFHITPNAEGNFVLQMIAPSMVENNGAMVGKSDIYFCNDAGLDGHVTTPLVWTPVLESRVTTGVFQAFVLCAASVKVAYMGRVDISSGYFGGSYHLTGTDVHVQDDSVQDFNYIENSFGSARAKLFSGVEVIYFPQDSAFQEFKRPSTNSAGNYVAMSHRLNVFGRGLAPGTSAPKSVMVTVTKVYATLPTPGFEDIVSAQSPVNELSTQQMEDTHKFIKETNLAVHELASGPDIEKLLRMSPLEKEDVLRSVRGGDARARREDVVSAVHDYLPPQIKIKLPSPLQLGGGRGLV